MFDLEQIKPAVISMLQVNMGFQQGESLLVVSDVPGPQDGENRELTRRAQLARGIFDICRKAFPKNQVDYLSFPTLGQSGKEPPQFVADRLAEYSVVLLLTTYSLSHTNARERATRAGARIASMPGIEYEMFLPGGPMAVDYAAVQSETGRLADLLSRASSVRVTTALGTDLRFSIAGRSGGPDTGLYTAPGQWGNLPGGEAFVAPVEGTASGRLVVPAGWYPGLQQDMVLEFAAGYVVSLSGGGRVGEEFTRLLAFGDESLRHRRNCAELGIGTNPRASRPDNVLEAEKIKGTIHIAIGDSSHLGGVTQSDLHEDFVIPHPRLYLDDRLVLGE